MSFVLKAGSTDPLVADLQSKLIAKGSMPAKDAAGNSNIDGRFGQITRDAVISYQQAHGLAPDGVVGRSTANSLGLELSPPALLPKSEHILSAAQLRKLAEAVDALIPTPVDYFDDAAIAWLVEKIDSTLAGVLPPKIANYLKDLAQGIELGDLGAFKKRLTGSLNQYINVPLLSEETEGKILGFVVEVVAESLQLGRSLDDALSKLLPKFVRT